MEIKGFYQLKKAFVGFDDDFNNKYMDRDEVLKLTLKQKDDMVLIAMMFARMEVEVTDTDLIFRFDPEKDEIAKKIAKGNKMELNDGKYSTIKYAYKKKGKKYLVVSEDGEEEGEVEFKDNTFEFNYSTFEKI